MAVVKAVAVVEVVVKVQEAQARAAGRAPREGRPHVPSSPSPESASVVLLRSLLAVASHQISHPDPHSAVDKSVVAVAARCMLAHAMVQGIHMEGMALMLVAEAFRLAFGLSIGGVLSSCGYLGRQPTNHGFLSYL